MRQLLPTWAPAPMPVHAVFASSRYLAPKVRAFIDLAVELFEDQEGDFRAREAVG